MSAFHRFLFSTFLLLALCFFAASSAFAATTYYYYRSADETTCNLQQSAICSYSIAKLNAISPNYQYSGCSLDGTSLALDKLAKTTTTNHETGQQTVTWIPYGSASAGRRISKSCSDGETLKLQGCTATCVADPCAPLKGQEFSGLGVCGSFSCSDGGVVQNGSCSKGQMTQSTGQAPQSMIDTNQCIGTFDRPNLTQKFYNKGDDEGKSSGAAYCSAFYKYTGLSSNDTVEDLNLFLLSAFAAVPMPDNGICPPDKPQPSTINGQQVCIPNTLPDDDNCPVDGEKQNTNGVCVGPNDPTYPDDDTTDPKPETGCPAGEIRNNAGKCVPYADAGKCPAGEIRNNLGTCSLDPKSNYCPQGQVKNMVTGACVTDPRGTGCEGNALPDKNGMCPNGKASCPVGKTRDSSGLCVGNNSNDPPDGTGCKDGSMADALGKCADGSGVCPVGQVRNIQGKCVVDNTNTPASATASGDCLSAPECSGDIIQCGLMHQQWQSGCDLQKSLTDIPEGGDIQYSEVGTDSSDTRVTAATGLFSSHVDDVKSLLGVTSASSCPADMSIQLLNRAIVIPISKACPLFLLMRFLLNLIVNLACLRILYVSFVGT